MASSVEFDVGGDLRRVSVVRKYGEYTTVDDRNVEEILTFMATATLVDLTNKNKRERAKLVGSWLLPLHTWTYMEHAFRDYPRLTYDIFKGHKLSEPSQALLKKRFERGLCEGMEYRREIGDLFEHVPSFAAQMGLTSDSVRAVVALSSEAKRLKGFKSVVRLSFEVVADRLGLPYK